MSCFWIGLLDLIDTQSINSVLGFQPFKITPDIFVTLLKSKNKLVYSVSCNGEYPSSQQQHEQLAAIESIESSNVENGYLCSAFDPVLFLISDLFNVDIDHNYLGVTISYKCLKARQKFYFASNSGHFWSIKKEQLLI